MTRRNMGIGMIVATVILGGIVAGSFVETFGHGSGAAAPTGPAPPCPVGFVDHVGSAARIRERLSEVPEGRALLDDVSTEVRFCFGDIDVPVVTEGRLLVLDARVSIAEQAARAGHLLDHVNSGLPFPDEITADADCDEIVDRATEAEARAYAIEVRLRRALDVEGARYEFEQTFWATDEDEREAMIERYLRDHPDGAPNMDALVGGYRQRCEVERSEASP